jgi:hypothetical protein
MGGGVPDLASCGCIITRSEKISGEEANLGRCVDWGNHSPSWIIPRLTWSRSLPRLAQPDAPLDAAAIFISPRWMIPRVMTPA